jgi:hypothetical protein
VRRSDLVPTDGLAEDGERARDGRVKEQVGRVEGERAGRRLSARIRQISTRR